MKGDKLIRGVIRALVLIFSIPLLLGAIAISDFIQKLLRKALREKGRDEVIRLLSYKGLFGIFDLIERRTA